MRIRVTLAILLFSLSCVLSSARAEWPERAITLVVPFPAGGVTDSIARVTAEWLAKQLKQSVVVENRPGASGAIAFNSVARAPSDGYTLLMATVVQMAFLPHMQEVQYDPLTSFDLVSIIGTSSAALAVNPAFPAKTLPELIAHAKVNPGSVPFASAGNGSLSHLSMVLLLKRAGISMNHIPYKGGALAMTDVIGGHVPMFFGNVSEVFPHYKDQKVNVVAVSGTKREDRMPNVPTVAEQGFPGFSTLTWNGIAVAAGTPAPIVKKLANALTIACDDAEFNNKLISLGVDRLCSNPNRSAEILKTDFVKWGEAMKDAGLARSK